MRLMLLLVGMLAVACGGEEGAEPEAGAPADDAVEAPCEPEAEGTEIELVALETKTGKLPSFDKTCLAVPAGQPFTVNLTNQDLLEHNFAIYRTEGDPASAAIFTGEIFRGPGPNDPEEGITETYEVPALDEPGVYHFRCDVHASNMTGTLIVR